MLWRGVCLLVCAALLSGTGYGKRSKVRRRHAPELVYKVAPSDAIESRVAEECAKAERVLAALDVANVFSSPYLISAAYYHDGFLGEFAKDKEDADPARRIIAHVKQSLTPQQREAIIEVLRDAATEDARFTGIAAPSIAPVPSAELGKSWRRRPAHKTAVDLFAEEGTPVHSISSGVVALAESTWNLADPFSTSSQKGGNTVIIFDPVSYRFYRYAHLEAAATTPGAYVRAGEVIGRVGHTGLNASRPKHGRHLHLEINQVEGPSVRSLTYQQIRGMLAGRR